MAEMNDLSTTDASNTARFPEGQAPSTVNDGARALEGILARWTQDTNGSLVSGGSSNAYTLSANQTLSAYAQNMIFVFEANHANTGAATLNVDSIGAKAIKKNHDQDLASGDIEQYQIVVVAYEGNGDCFQLLSAVANGSLGQSLARGSAYAGNSSGAAAAVDISTAGNALVGDGTDAVATGVLTQGKHTIWIPAGAMRPTVSSGCAKLTDVETTAGRPDMQVLDFDAGSDEHAQFQIAMPQSWNRGTVTFQVFWTTTHTGTDGVAWGLQGVAVSNDDTIDAVYGTAVVVTDDALSAAEDMMVTAESDAVTIAGTPAAGDVCFFRLFRDVSDSNDDMTEDARLIGVKLFVTLNTPNDA